MRVQNKSRLGRLALVAGMVVVMVGTEAMAQSYGSWGSSGSYGSSGSSASYGSYGSSGSSASSGSYGSSGRMGLFARMRARRATRHSSSGSYGSSGSSGSSASYGSYGSSGSSASYGSSYSTPVYSDPVYSEPTEVEADPVQTDGTTSIKVKLPEGAKVFVNDAPTTSTGSDRNYVSRGLRSGMTYAYNIRVEYMRDGEPVSESEQVKLRAGQSVSLTFGQSDESVAETTEPVETEVKVEVPEDARVFLSGAPTKQTGTSRTYSSSQLAAGQQWEGYTVRVEVDREGQTLVREEKLTVEGGHSYELAFDFDSTATAQLAQLDN
jgi:uncharacterized protein (TIGR03000 family)